VPTVPSKRLRAAGAAAAVLALAGVAWLWALSKPGGVSPVPVRERAGGGPTRPVPSVEGWTPIDAGEEQKGALRLYRADESPESAAVRVARAFRAAGWSSRTSTRKDPDGRHVLVFRSGGAVCWVMVEKDPRTGRTRCAVAGP
jgi:hypothetical protein